MYNRFKETYIRKDVYDAMLTEAASKCPMETGGTLLGKTVNGVLDITTYIGPGPNARHDRFGFLGDHEHYTKEIDRLWEISDDLEYIGGWHTHPGGSGFLSPLDTETIEAIYNEIVPKQLLVATIIINGFDDKWWPNIWTYDGAFHSPVRDIKIYTPKEGVLDSFTSSNLATAHVINNTDA